MSLDNRLGIGKFLGKTTGVFGVVVASSLPLACDSGYETTKVGNSAADKAYVERVTQEEVIKIAEQKAIERLSGDKRELRDLVKKMTEEINSKEPGDYGKYYIYEQDFFVEHKDTSEKHRVKFIGDNFIPVIYLSSSPKSQEYNKKLKGRQKDSLTYTLAKDTECGTLLLARIGLFRQGDEGWWSTGYIYRTESQLDNDEAISYFRELK